LVELLPLKDELSSIVCDNKFFGTFSGSNDLAGFPIIDTANDLLDWCVKVVDGKIPNDSNMPIRPDSQLIFAQSGALEEYGEE
jgi:hypothetical protein